ncbi:hypothetical protein 000TH008_41 [Bacillus phage 000TH008]|nr:hypothetical protein 000TH008_41 [Bacillus phage 000TH008]QQO40735.1 hypothetical protein 000TH009_41 [Bacillus phage 000TH009]
MLSSDKMIDLLVELLDCSPNDLSVLEGCSIPMKDLIDHAMTNSYTVNLNRLIKAMFDLALKEVQDAIYNSGGELNIVKDTYQYVDGAESFIQFENNENIYRWYFENEISIFEGITGMTID